MAWIKRAAMGCLPLLFAAAALASPHTFHVKLRVQAPALQKYVLISRLSQDLRKLGDVQIVDFGEDYEISLVCVKEPHAPVLACAVDYDAPSDLSAFNAYIQPEKMKIWKLVAAAESGDNVNMLQTIQIAGFAKLGDMASVIADTLNGHYLEKLREGFATSAHRAAPRQ